MKRLLLILCCVLLLSQTCWAGRAKIDTIAKNPYISAYLIDADTGEVLVNENGGSVAYPASVLKMMVLQVVLDHVQRGAITLDEMVQVTPEAARMGGSQVYLDPKEQFPVEDLLYTLMIQSANDAAVALAIHIAGSKEGFIAQMNQRAAELGMKNSTFHSVHGLPPGEGEQPDTTTAEDLAILARELARNPETFKYTGSRERPFRNGEFIMRTHNHLLESVDGCDGFKTGYYTAAGFSIVATAKRAGVRLIAVVLGSTDRKVRDAKAMQLLASGFTKVPARPEGVQPVGSSAPVETVPQPAPKVAVEPPQAEEAPAPQQKAVAEDIAVQKEAGEAGSGGKMIIFLMGFASGIIFMVGMRWFLSGGRRSVRRSRFS